MNENVAPNTDRIVRLLNVSPSSRVHKGRAFAAEKLTGFYAEIENYLTQGFAAEAEERCLEVLENYRHSLDTQSQLNCFVSLALEMEGRFAESLEVLKPFENKEFFKELEADNYASLLLRQGIAYTNLRETSKAISLLTLSQRIAEERDFIPLLVKVHAAFARVYRDTNEFSVSRNYVDKAIRYSRRVGDWRGAAETLQINAVGYLVEGNSEQAVEEFRKAIQLIGNRPASFLLGKIHSDISVAYHALNRPQDGVESAKKAVALLEKTNNKYQTAIFFNNLGINYLLNGEWKKAGEFVEKATDSGLEINHAHLASFICTAGELNLLQGDLEEAEKLFTRALELSEEKQKDWYSAQILYNLACCYLAQSKTTSAIQAADKTIKLCEKINENKFKYLTKVVLAESWLKQKKIREAEDILFAVEEHEAENFALQGFSARVRGAIAIESKDEELAVHHFNRSLAAFHKIGDLYQTALADYKLGVILAKSQTEKAINHLTFALETFRKLGAESKIQLAQDILESLQGQPISTPREQAGNSHLLMLRLIESISSREILFREFADILKDESKAKKIILADVRHHDLFAPCLFNNYSEIEAKELLDKLAKANVKNELDDFAKENDLSVFQLRSMNALPALLVISPASGGTLTDGSSLHPLLKVTELGMEVCALRVSNETPTLDESNPLSTRQIMPDFIYSSKPMLDLVNEIQKIRTSDVTTLITGESGAGKEVVAKAIHAVSKRKDKVFVPFNCTAIPRDLVEGQLFGYKKGAFTGADSDYEGIIRSADGGTLFLDEIGDLGLDVQPKLLRFLQENEVQTLGEKTPQKVDVRIIAATNMNLEAKMREGLFRQDLFYRLNVIRLSIPPLRERRSEIPELVKYFLDLYSDRFGRQNLTVSPEAMSALIAHDWEGNVRQLCNEVQRMVARAESGDRIGLGHLSQDLLPADGVQVRDESGEIQVIGLTEGAFNVQTEGKTLDEVVSALEIQMIKESMERNKKKGKTNLSQVAKELGLTRRGLYLKIDRYKIQSDEKAD